nr:hypothetical protein [Haloechinothrix sp. LS1_15]
MLKRGIAPLQVLTEIRVLHWSSAEHSSVPVEVQADDLLLFEQPEVVVRQAERIFCDIKDADVLPGFHVARYTPRQLIPLVVRQGMANGSDAADVSSRSNQAANGFSPRRIVIRWLGLTGEEGGE